MYGEKLRVARKRKNMTLEQVAQLMNTTHATISRYETEARKVDPDTLVAFCRLYNVSANYILGLPEDMPHPSD